MPLRVYCPECATPRTAPEVGARVRCRVCDRVFRAGTRAERRDRRDDPTRLEGPDGSRTLALVLGGLALLLVGLVIGGGLGGWLILARQPACPPPGDEEMIEVEEDGGPPPEMANPGPVNPGPLADPGP